MWNACFSSELQGEHDHRLVDPSNAQPHEEECSIRHEAGSPLADGRLLLPESPGDDPKVDFEEAGQENQHFLFFVADLVPETQ